MLREGDAVRAFAATVATFAALAILAGACAGCTTMGCSSFVQFNLDVVLRVGDEIYARACVDDFCRDLEGPLPTDACLSTDESDSSTLLVCSAQVPSAGEVELILPEGQDYEGAHEIRLELHRDDDVIAEVVEADVEFERTQPNQNCPPVCWEARVEQA